MPKRAVFERSRQELSLDVSVGVHILLVVEQSSLESQSRGCAKTSIRTVYPSQPKHSKLCTRFIEGVTSKFWKRYRFFFSSSSQILGCQILKITPAEGLYQQHALGGGGEVLDYDYEGYKPPPTVT